MVDSLVIGDFGSLKYLSDSTEITRIDHQSTISNSQRVRDQRSTIPIALMDLFIILGLAARGERRRHPARVPPAGAAVSSGYQSGRPCGRGAFPRDSRGLRNADRSGAPLALRGWAAGGTEPTPPRSTGFEGFDFSRRGGEQAVTFGDLFGEVLHERHARSAGVCRARRRPASGPASCSFDESFTGVTRSRSP